MRLINNKQLKNIPDKVTRNSLYDVLAKRRAICPDSASRPIEIGLTFPTTEVLLCFSALVLRLFAQREVVWKTTAPRSWRIRAWTIGRGERASTLCNRVSRKFRATAMIASAQIGAISRFAQCQCESRDVIAIIFSQCTTCRYSSDRVLIPRITVGSTVLSIIMKFPSEVPSESCQ